MASPTRFGVTSDVQALAKVWHNQGIPRIIDAAWRAAGVCRQADV